MNYFLSKFWTNEAVISITAFAGIFVIMAIWEVIYPRRKLTVSKASRWFTNLCIIFINTILVRAVFAVSLVFVAALAQDKKWGLLNQFDLPLWLAIVLGVLLLDLVIYFQHVMFHTLPVLWRLHLVHHADLDIDLSTGLRFHPVEIIISMVLKFAAVSALGPDPAAVILFEIVLNAMSMFSHGNVKIPYKADKILRWFIITPDMHRVHHSVIINETNSNFGFNVSWWDLLFGTYRDQPASGHTAMTIGHANYRNPRDLTLPRLIILPFTAVRGSYDIRGRGREPDTRL